MRVEPAHSPAVLLPNWSHTAGARRLRQMADNCRGEDPQRALQLEAAAEVRERMAEQEATHAEHGRGAFLASRKRYLEA